jgi:uncharacterized protein DUF3995
MKLIAACVFSAVLILLSALHVYWATGGRWGTDATVPVVNGQRTIRTTPLSTYIVAILLATGAAIMAGEARLFPTGPLSRLFHIGAWCLSGVFFARAVGNFQTFGFFKRIGSTSFAYWDTHLYSPLCLLLAILACAVALS